MHNFNSSSPLKALILKLLFQKHPRVFPVSDSHPQRIAIPFGLPLRAASIARFSFSRGKNPGGVSLRKAVIFLASVLSISGVVSRPFIRTDHIYVRSDFLFQLEVKILPILHAKLQKQFFIDRNFSARPWLSDSGKTFSSSIAAVISSNGRNSSLYK